jgi:hypothetical protein
LREQNVERFHRSSRFQVNDGKVDAESHPEPVAALCSAGKGDVSESSNSAAQ